MGASAVTPKVPMGLRTCWKSCGTLPWRSWTFRVALKFRPPRGRSCASWTNLREAGFYGCFRSDTKGADGAADLLEVLRNSPLEKLNFSCCSQIPSSAWQKLRGASWTNLKEADFSACFGFGTSADGAADLLEVLRQSPLTFVFALKFRPVRGSEFPMAHGPRCVMQTASPRRSCTASVAATSRGCFRCFNSDTKGADGAADLLEVLRNSPLEKLDFSCCSQIPSTAWQKLCQLDQFKRSRLLWVLPQ